MDRAAWGAVVQWVTNNWTGLSDYLSLSALLRLAFILVVDNLCKSKLYIPFLVNTSSFFQTPMRKACQSQTSNNRGTYKIWMFGCVFRIFTKEFQYSIWWNVKKKLYLLYLRNDRALDKLIITFKFMVDIKWTKRTNYLSGFNRE